MAAYGALVSVMQIMDQLHRHPHPPISLDQNQSEALTANVTFLQEFLEGYNPHVSYTSEADPLESRIAEAAYAAEDVIESYIVDQILSRSTDHAEEITSNEFSQGLQKVIEEMDLIKIEVVEMKDKKKMGVQIIKKSTTDAAISSHSSSTAQEVAMVGFDDVLIQMLDKITGGERVRQIIPIVGMGGLGKTTLARNIYANQFVKEHFDICAWSTISQVHNAPKILREILGQVGLHGGGGLSEYELGEKLYKHLIGKRYLIVMDDMWSVKAWDVVRSFFPEDENGSRVVVTTRLSNLASKFNYSDGLDMKFLDKDSSWKLFCKTVFGEETCPLELDKIGKKIVKGCRGLPLSIVVVGGILSKSGATLEDWQRIDENSNSLVNLDDGGSCLQILYMSYNNLPIYIKPCLLYMGMFPEDEKIPVNDLIHIWVAEGIIRPFEGKSFEEVAEDCIQELIDRNLVLVEKRDECGKPKIIKIHDLVRDVCVREGRKHKFVCVLMQSDDREISQGMISCQRRIATDLHREFQTPLLESLEAATSSQLVRTFIGSFPNTLSISSFRLQRVCVNTSSYVEERCREYFEEMFIRLVNLRLLLVNNDSLVRIPSSVTFLWNLQTLRLRYVSNEFVLEIWKMPLLRHVMTDKDTDALCLPDAPPINDDDKNQVVLQNLYTLFEVRNLNFSEEVLKRIPNIKKLKLRYWEEEEEELGDYGLRNLCRIHKLQILRLITIGSSASLQLKRELTLPYSLKKLTLDKTQIPWENMTTKIGCLPLLQVLKVEYDAFIGSEWETVEGQFTSLKFLLIWDCSDLEHWITDNAHFPRLEHLVLRRLSSLREIPLSIGDIPTLRSIRLSYFHDSVVESAERIREEQEEYGNELLQIVVHGRSSSQLPSYVTSPLQIIHHFITFVLLILSNSLFRIVCSKLDAMYKT